MFQFPYFHHVSYRDGMPPNFHKCKLKQNIRTFNSISKVMTPSSTTNQSTHLFCLAVSHAWVYNLSCTPLLTILHSRREMHTWLRMCWMVSMIICTSWWHTSSRCYTLLAFGRFDSGAPTSTFINTSQWFPSLVAWTHLWSLLAHVHLFRGVRLHVISNPILHLMCLKLATCFVSYCLFDLSCRSKLCPFFEIFLL